MQFSDPNAIQWIEALHRDYLSIKPRISTPWLNFEAENNQMYDHYSLISIGSAIKARILKEGKKTRTLFQLYGDPEIPREESHWDNNAISIFDNHGKVPGVQIIPDARGFIQRLASSHRLILDARRPSTIIFSLRNNVFSNSNFKNLLIFLDTIGCEMYRLM